MPVGLSVGPAVGEEVGVLLGSDDAVMDGTELG